MTNDSDYGRIFYHIYPLGLCGAPRTNDGGEPVERLRKLFPWADYLADLGVNHLYLGPLFESGTHGYDTTDYFTVDRRLGTNSTLAELCGYFHERGINVILDGVFNHVGRGFPRFGELVREGGSTDWFARIDFNGRSPYGDPFSYEGWNGNYDLVKLNLKNPEVRRHLFDAVSYWKNEFGIDGLRLDAADCIDLEFLAELSRHCRSIDPGFFLVGEVVHGDYNRWANPYILDSVTNYECYKGLWSSHNDVNYFEIAYSFNREFGRQGIYRNIPLYNFADNHDVPRVASTLKNPADIFTLYLLLFTMPGIPSIYYGSEWGMTGEKTNGQDYALRPEVDLDNMHSQSPNPGLYDMIRRLIAIRRGSGALMYGEYIPLHVDHRQMAFARCTGDETVIVAVNSSAKEAEIELNLKETGGGTGYDLLNNEEISLGHSSPVKMKLYPNWGRIIRM